MVKRVGFYKVNKDCEIGGEPINTYRVYEYITNNNAYFKVDHVRM